MVNRICKLKILIIFYLLCANILFSTDYWWYARYADKNFNTAANWSPAVAPAGEHPSTTLAEYMVQAFQVYGAAEINSDLNMSYATINAGGGGNGVVNIRSGNIVANRIQAGMRNVSGIVNIYGGTMNLIGIPTRIDVTGALRAYYGGVINFYGGTVEMDYALWISSNCTLNIYNAGAHEKAPNALKAPIFAKCMVNFQALKVENGALNVKLAQGITLRVDEMIYLIEYNGEEILKGFKNIANGQTINIDGFNFRLEMGRVIGEGRRAVVLVALQAVDTRLKKGSVIMISKNERTPVYEKNS